MRKLALLGALVLAFTLIAVPVSAGGNGHAGEKTWVCHVTHSTTNPVIVVQVNQGWDSGHGNGGPAKHQTEDIELEDYDGKAGPAEKVGVFYEFKDGVLTECFVDNGGGGGGGVG